MEIFGRQSPIDYQTLFFCFLLDTGYGRLPLSLIFPYNPDVENILLHTKLYIPPPRSHFVPRPNLIQKLNQGLESKLTLISAPAGYGKTTLAADWLSQLTIYQPQFYIGNYGWLSLDKGDNQPARFLSYFVAALQNINGQIGQDLMTMLQSPLIGAT